MHTTVPRLGSLILLIAVILPPLAGQEKPGQEKPVLPLSVFSFGAVGDGKTDDTAALKRAILAGQGGLRFGKGTFLIRETIEIRLDEVGFTSIVGDGTATVVMAGAGPAFRIVGTHAGTADPGSVKDEVWQRQRAPLVEGIEIVGDHPDSGGIEANGTMQLIVNRVIIRKVKHGIRLANRNRNVIISLCQIYENRGIGIFYDHVNLHQSNISNCHISYNQLGGVVVRGGDVRNVHIGTCDIEGNMAVDGPPTANVLFDATGGSIGEIAITGCTIQHDHRVAGSANIRINAQSVDRAITTELRHGNITISANVLSDVQTNIDVKNSRGLTIVGNTMWKGYTANLVLDNCQSFAVSANVFDRNPRYHYGDGGDAHLGLQIRNSNDGSISANVLHGTGDIPAAIDVQNCGGLNLTGNSVFDPQNAAIRLTKVHGSRVSGSLLRVASPHLAIVTKNASDNQLTDNMVTQTKP